MGAKEINLKDTWWGKTIKRILLDEGYKEAEIKDLVRTGRVVGIYKNAQAKPGNYSGTLLILEESPHEAERPKTVEGTSKPIPKPINPLLLE